MERKFLFFVMLCCLAFSANACGTNDTSVNGGTPVTSAGND